MNDDERRLLGKCFTEIRDARQKEIEVIDEFLNELGKPIMDVTPKAQETTKRVEVPENTFNLAYKERTGPRMGDFEVTGERDNDPKEPFQNAIRVLEQNNATIKTQYHCNGYTHSYWIYNGAIFRKKRSD